MTVRTPATGGRNVTPTSKIKAKATATVGNPRAVDSYAAKHRRAAAMLKQLRIDVDELSESADRLLARLG